MFIDKQNLMSEEQAVTADAASTNIIDLEANGGSGDAGKSVIMALVKVIVAFNNCTNIKFSIQTSSDAFSSSNEELVSKTVAVADLTEGASISFGCIPEGCLRYIRLYYDVTGTTPTTGKITAALVSDLQTN